MRITLFVCAVTSLLSAPAFAQGMQAGVRAGVNLASVQLDGDSDNSLDSQLRSVFGGFLTMPLISWLELQPEALYAMKGARSEESGIESRLLLDYVEIPVLARISRPAFGSRELYVVSGPCFGVRMRARTRTEFSGSTEEMDIKEDVKQFDFGVVLGGGLEFGAFVIDVRYTLGLSDIDEDTSDNVKITNRALSLTAGIKF